MLYRHNTREVDALFHDGSARSASDIAARFSGAVFEHGDRLEVATNAGRIYIGAGFWVTRDRATRALHVVDDRDFAANHEPIEAPQACVTRKVPAWHGARRHLRKAAAYLARRPARGRWGRPA